MVPERRETAVEPVFYKILPKIVNRFISTNLGALSSNMVPERRETAANRIFCIFLQIFKNMDLCPLRVGDVPNRLLERSQELPQS